MKKVVITGILVFLAAAIAGYIIAAASGRLPPFPTRLPIGKNPDAEQQQKILVILVDDLKSSEPVVESIWMIYTYPESQPYLVFLPVFSLKDQKAYPDVQSSFKYGFLGKIPADFWNVLKDSFDLRWDHYVIMDNQAFSQVIKLITGKNAPKLLSQPPNLKKPADYKSVVDKYIKAYCSTLKSGKTDPAWNEEWSGITADIQSDIKPDQLAAAWAWFFEHPQETPCNIVSSK